MSATAVTFAVPGTRRSDVLAVLTGLGFELGPGRTVTRTILDTFDGRVHRAGLRLAAVDSAGLELVLAGDGDVAAGMRLTSLPSIPNDLVAGPLRTRLAGIVGIRTLMPQVVVSAREVEATWPSPTGAPSVVVQIADRRSIAGHDTGDHVLVTVRPMPGFAKRARATIAALEPLGGAPRAGDAMAIAAADAGVDLAGFSGSPSAPLSTGMSASDGFRAVLIDLDDAMEANWQGTIDQLDTEFLHGLRVAVRRTRAVLAEGKKVLPPATVELARDRFSWLGEITGPARDLDVQLLEWDTSVGHLPPEIVLALRPVQQLLETRRLAAHRDLVAAMQSDDAVAWRAAWRGWLQHPAGDAGEHGDRQLGRVVRRRIERAQVALVRQGRAITPETPAEEVHELRKDAKKIRYLIECFAGLLPKGPRKGFVRHLKALQNNLGDHQDAAVLVIELQRIAETMRGDGATDDTIAAVAALTGSVDARRVAAREAFSERFANYDSHETSEDLDDLLDGLG